jgi:hypothetical protein
MKINGKRVKIGCAGRGPGAGVASRRGIALVITLIMLSVTLVMAIAFVALARRERSAVSTGTDTTTAKLAADSALAAAQAQIMANILNTNTASTPQNGLYNFGLLVSTNYINTNGFLPGSTSPTNVNYNYTSDNSAYSLADFEQNVANLQYLPRVPVFVTTNLQTGGMDFRYYLDLNRNGRYDTNGVVANLNDNNEVIGSPVTEVGDPEWVGMLARPDATHSADNQFVSRYAFIAVPIGNALDINAIHNLTDTGPKTSVLTGAADGFFRNEGVGSWEINLGAFLTDLDPDEWNPLTDPYEYNEANVNPTPNSGAGFDDALSIVSYRYNNAYNSLAAPYSPFPNPAIAFSPHSLYGAVATNGIDGYTVGFLMTGTQLPTVDYPSVGTSWAGSDNTNHFYNLPSELFNVGESSSFFTNRLQSAGTNNFTFDRYAYYRLLSQLGTDSDPDDGKMNLNYRNVTNGVVIPGMETNCYPWTAIEFFTNAADRMLRLYTTNWFYANPTNYLSTYYSLFVVNNNYNFFYPSAYGTNRFYDPNGFGLTNFTTSRFMPWTNVVPAMSITNIPVYVNGQFVYSPAVNRVLQQAANLYDATTTNFYPSVFRPIFEHDNLGNVFIVGYTNLWSPAFGVNTVDITGGKSDPQLTLPVDITGITNFGANYFPIITNGTYANVYGVPWIIGAKKNLPSFNQFSLINEVQAQRLLQIGRTPQGDGTWSPVWTNHMYLLSISNVMNASFWNSYSNNYPTNYPGALNLAAYVSDTLGLYMTNSDHPGNPSISFFTTNFVFNPAVWPGSKWSSANDNGTLENGNSAFLANNWTNSFFPAGTEIYKTEAKQFALTTDPDPFETNNRSNDPLPQFGLLTTNWVRAMILDNNEHVVDYVQLRGPTDGTNYTSALADPSLGGAPKYYLWATNLFGSGPTSWGYVDQMSISTGFGAPPASAAWNNPTLPSIPGLSTVTAAQDFLNSMFSASSSFNYTVNGQTLTYTNTEPIVQAGYSGVRTVFVPYLYQVNDPLVHYLASDLNAGAGATWSGNKPMTNGIWVQNNGVVSYAFPAAPVATDIIHSRYQPWGKIAPTTVQSASYNFGNPYNMSYKDPLVWGPDGWEFPTNAYPTVGWMGRVHRGSPWQTVFLKATNIVVGGGNLAGTNTWAAWTGDNSLFDAANSAPVQDRLLFDLFTTRFNDNGARGTLSVNQTNLAAWSAVFSGMVVLTNVTDVPPFNVPAGVTFQAATSWTNIQPAAVNGTLLTLVTNMNFVRSNIVNPDGVLGSFEHAGDILAIPALTEHSPFLNWNNNTNQPLYGISDAAYEWLPQQMMSLVRESSTPRYVIYCYGQTLRPAPGGLVTSGSNFGLVTNYQVVAESSVRAVITVQKQVNMSGSWPVTNYTAKVESYSVLPPD